jgi:Tfp pilus assembly major pilin PilA
MQVVSSGHGLVKALTEEKQMKKQQGMTLIGWVFVLGIIAFFATFAMRLLPMYQEYYSVLQIMDSMETEIKNNQLTKQQVTSLLNKRFNTGYVFSVKDENIDLGRGKNGAYVTRITIDYEVRKPFIAQIDLVGHFVTEVDIEQPTTRTIQ